MFQLNNKLDEEMRQRENVTRHLLTIAGYQPEEELYYLNPEQIVNIRTGELVTPLFIIINL